MATILLPSTGSPINGYYSFGKDVWKRTDKYSFTCQNSTSTITLDETYSVKECFLTEPLHYGTHSHELVVSFQNLLLCFPVDSRPEYPSALDLENGFDLSSLDMGANSYYETKTKKVIFFLNVLRLRIPPVTDFSRKRAKKKYKDIYDPPGILDTLFHFKQENEDEPYEYQVTSVNFSRKDVEAFGMQECTLLNPDGSKEDYTQLSTIGSSRAQDASALAGHFIIFLTLALFLLPCSGTLFLLLKDKAIYRGIFAGIVLGIFGIVGVVLFMVGLFLKQSPLLAAGTYLTACFTFCMISNNLIWKVHKGESTPKIEDVSGSYVFLFVMLGGHYIGL